MARAQTTLSPTSPIQPTKFRLSDAKKSELRMAMIQRITSTLADRQPLDAKLIYWNQLYEQDIGERNYPWDKAANMFVPIVPTYCEAIFAQLQAQVFIQRFFIVTGNDSEASKVAYDVERYYNEELWRQDWIRPIVTVLQLAIRDGTGIMEIVWERTTRNVKKLEQRPRMVKTPLGELPALDPVSGEIQLDLEANEFTVTDFDNVRLNPVELRDFILAPMWAKSIESALGVGRAMYLDEEELRKMVAGEELWAKETEDAIRYSSTLTSDLGQDTQSTDTYTAAGSIDIGAERGALISGDIQVVKGPLKVWRYHTREFEITEGQGPEELVLWYHEPSNLLIGVSKFAYVNGRRPFMECVLMPRPNRFLGFGVPERLQFLQIEGNAIENQIIDRGDLALQAPFYQTEDVKIISGEKEWGPGARYQVSSKDDIGIITLPSLPAEVQIIKQDIDTNAQRLLGFMPPQGMGSTTRRSRYEMMIAAQGTQIRLASMGQQLRGFMKRVLVYVNDLKKQYGPDEQTLMASQGGKPQQITVTKDMLSQNLSFDVSGDVTGPDKQARVQEATVVYQTIAQDPIVASNPQHRYASLRNFLEAVGVGNVVDLIGTEEEAIQQFQQQQQAAQQAAAMGQDPTAATGGVPSGPPGGVGQPGGQQKPPATALQ